MMTIEDMTRLITQRIKDTNLETVRELGRQWQVKVDEVETVAAELSRLIAGATFGLGVTMMFETGHTEDQIVEIVRRLVRDLSAPAEERGAS